jgi:hypothetical protein
MNLDPVFVSSDDIRAALFRGAVSVDEMLPLIKLALSYIKHDPLDDSDAPMKETDLDSILFDMSREQFEEKYEDIAQAVKLRNREVARHNALRLLKKEIEENRPYFEALFVPGLSTNSVDIQGASNDRKSTSVASPITWYWGPADLGWLHNTLKSVGAISCGPSAFSALFIDQEGNHFTDDIGSAYKGSEPKRERMKQTRAQILRHKPENDQTST